MRTLPEMGVETVESRPFLGRAFDVRPRVPTLLAVGWLVLVAGLYLAPSLIHGFYLGPQDVLGTYGVGSVPGTQVHNFQTSDQIMDMIPWTDLAWQQVHHGQLPLWNPYAGLGLPLAFNFQSAPFSLPTVISYLVPLRFAYSAVIFVRLVIAGTGVLWFCRRLGLGNVAGAFAGMVFELSGAVTAWIGWPHANVACWFGWVFGSLIVVLEGRRRGLAVTSLALSLAMAAYGGHPETFFLMTLSAVVFSSVWLVQSWHRSRDPKLALRGLGDLALGGLGGLALAAPLLLPGVEILQRSVRSRVLDWAISWKDIVNVAFPQFHGSPTRGNIYFDSNTYYETACYVGIVAVVLAALAVWNRRRSSAVWGLVALIPVAIIATYSKLFVEIVNSLPGTGEVQWNRMELVFDMVLAVLAGMGFDVLRRTGGSRRVRVRFGYIALSAALAVALVAALRGYFLEMPQLAFIQNPISSFLWPVVSLGVVLLVAAAMLDANSSGRKAPVFSHVLATPRVAGGLLFGIQALFLLTASPGIEPSSSTFFALTPAERSLQQLVGAGRVGMGNCPLYFRPNLGILPEANSEYGISEAAAFDGVVPTSWFDSYYGFTCVVRPKADSDSGGIRTSVPGESGRAFRLIPDTGSG